MTTPASQLAGSAVTGPGAPPPAPDLTRLARGGVLNLVGAAVSAAASFAFVVLLTRASSSTDAGLFFAATGVFVVVTSVARLGAPTGVVYFISRARAARGSGALGGLGGIVRVALAPVALLSVMAALALAAAARPLAAALSPQDAEDLTVALRVLAVFLPAATVIEVLLAVTRGLGAVRPLVVVEKVARPVAQLVLLGVAVAADVVTSATVVLAWAVPYLPAAVAAGLWARRLSRTAASRAVEEPRASAAEGAGQARPATAGSTVAVFWRYSGPLSVSVIAKIVLQRMDILLLAALRGPAEAAVYGAVTRFLVVGQLGGTAISSTVQPRLGALLGRGDLAGAGRVYRASTGWLVIATWPFYLLVAVFADVATGVFGADYRRGSSVVVLLMLTMLVATGVGVVDVVLEMAGKAWYTVGNGMAALAVNVVLNLLLIPSTGMVGAGIAWAAAIGVNNLVPLLQVRARVRLHPFGRGVLLAMASAAACFAVVPAAVRIATGDSVTSLLLAAVLGVAGYGACLWRLRQALELKTLLRVRGPRGQAGAGRTAAPSRAS